MQFPTVRCRLHPLGPGGARVLRWSAFAFRFAVLLAGLVDVGLDLNRLGYSRAAERPLACPELLEVVSVADQP